MPLSRDSPRVLPSNEDLAEILVSFSMFSVVTFALKNPQSTYDKIYHLRLFTLLPK